MNYIVNNKKTGVELLRIIAMFGIVLGHFIVHGGGFTDNNVVNNPLYIIEQLLNSFFSFKVNIFIFITGYFLISKEHFDVKNKVGSVWKLEFFYSVVIAGLFFLCGIDVGVIECIKSFMPVAMYLYWFITLYIVLLLLTPIINKAFAKMNELEYRKAIIILVLLTSVWQTIMPFVTTIDNNRGYSILWFSVLYSIGGYIYKYYSKNKLSKLTLFFIYIFASLGQFAYELLLKEIQNMTDVSINIPEYNSFFTFVSSLAIFILFLEIDFNGKLAEMINKLAKHVIAIYLISDNPMVRGVLYDSILEIDKYKEKGFFSLVVVLAMSSGIFIICLFIEYMRTSIIKMISKSEKKFIKR